MNLTPTIDHAGRYDRESYPTRGGVVFREPSIVVAIVDAPVHGVRPTTTERAQFRERFVRRALGDTSARWKLTGDPSGRPRLTVDGQPHCDISSASTYGRLAAALGFGARVGIDVEQVSASSVDDTLVREVLQPTEMTLMSTALDPPAFFFALWCRKEAVLKGLGLGLSLHPRELMVAAPSGAHGWTAVATPVETWFVRSIATHTGEACAVAADRPSADIWHLLTDPQPPRSASR